MDYQFCTTSLKYTDEYFKGHCAGCKTHTHSFGKRKTRILTLYDAVKKLYKTVNKDTLRQFAIGFKGRHELTEMELVKSKFKEYLAGRGVLY